MTSTPSSPANRLAAEPSLYLRQHAHNPVDWYPWGEEAFAEARRRDCPVLVSIGYSSCHWCHVMEHESFEDPDVAALQNASFVSIKVDREERPDVDAVYMSACQLMTRQGGWPLNVFLAPDGRPFWAGTYFPPTPRFGRPSWSDVLTGLSRAWADRRDEVLASADELVSAMRRMGGRGPAPAPRTSAVVAAANELFPRRDPVHGGFGHAPKFPNVMYLEALLGGYEHTGEEEWRDHVVATLRSMSDGGIYDHLGGGFARYSVDERWAVPHFEKMLYDNGLLLRVLGDAFRLSGDERLADVARDIARYLAREMTDTDGAFYATLDADSEGEEGRFYVWTPEQVRAAVGDDAEFACRLYGVSEHGNFEHSGATVLFRAASDEELAEEFGIPVADASARVLAVRDALFAAREGRVRPARDEKRMAAWNGLAIHGLARAGRTMGDDSLVAMAAAAAEGVLDTHVAEGRLHRICSDVGGTVRRVPAFLDDHANLALGLAELFCATGDTRWLERGRELVGWIAERFHRDGADLGSTPNDGEELVIDLRSAFDEATPSAVGAAVLALVRYGELTGETAWLDLASATVAAHGAELAASPSGAATLAQAADAGRDGVTVAVLVVPPGTDGAAASRDAGRTLGPHAFVVVHEDGADPPAGIDEGFVSDRRARGGAPTWYVCRGGTCSAPAATLGEALASEV